MLDLTLLCTFTLLHILTSLHTLISSCTFTSHHLALLAITPGDHLLPPHHTLRASLGSYFNWALQLALSDLSHAKGISSSNTVDEDSLPRFPEDRDSEGEEEFCHQPTQAPTERRESETTPVSEPSSSRLQPIPFRNNNQWIQFLDSEIERIFWDIILQEHKPLHWSYLKSRCLSKDNT